MRVRFKNRAGYDSRAHIEEGIMLIRLDGTVVTSLPDTYCNERLLTPEEKDRAIESVNQEKGEHPL